MDLLSLPTRLLTRPVAAALDVEGSTPKERADNLWAEANLEPDDPYALAERHLTRSVIWLAVVGVLFPAGIPVSWLIDVPGGGLGVFGAVFLAVYWTISLSAGVLFLLHVIKFLFAHYVIRRHWNLRSRPWRFAMLNQWPDAVIAVALAIAVQLSF
jgi:hypothetical protein